MPLHNVHICEIFYAGGVDFMGPFPPTFGFTYILMLVNYVSKWNEVVAPRADDAKTVVKHVKSLILHRCGVPKAIISHMGTHFYNKTLGPC